MKKQSTVIPVICHDTRVYISGVIQKVEAQGCELVCNGTHHQSVFPKKARVLMNIQDDSTNSSVSVEARLVDVTRNKGSWVYRVRWKEAPNLPCVKKAS